MKNKGFKGKKHSLASLQKMRLAKLGKKRPPFSAQWIKNLVNSRKGYRHSCETKKKIGLSNSINQRGEKNSQYGKCWVYNLELKENKTIKKEEINEWLEKGWIKGRKQKF